MQVDELRWLRGVPGAAHHDTRTNHHGDHHDPGAVQGLVRSQSSTVEPKVLVDKLRRLRSVSSPWRRRARVGRTREAIAETGQGTGPNKDETQPDNDARMRVGCWGNLKGMGTGGGPAGNARQTGVRVRNAAFHSVCGTQSDPRKR